MGIGQVGVGMLRDLRGCLAVSDRDGPPQPWANCTLIARRSSERDQAFAAASYARPVPPHTVQIAGVQVCAFRLQVHPRAGTRPPPLHSGHGSVLFMIAPIRVASHLVGFTR